MAAGAAAVSVLANAHGAKPTEAGAPQPGSGSVAPIAAGASLVAGIALTATSIAVKSPGAKAALLTAGAALSSAAVGGALMIGGKAMAEGSAILDDRPVAANPWAVGAIGAVAGAAVAGGVTLSARTNSLIPMFMAPVGALFTTLAFSLAHDQQGPRVAA